MRIARATAHPNIALVKYWGKRDEALNLPAVPSLSVALDAFSTRTEVRWGAPADRFSLDGAAQEGREAAKIARFLDLVDPGRPPVEVESRSDFPAGAGLASSASGFAALALAACAAAGRALDRAALSALARRGSGSACRSLWGGFVEWRMGERPDGADSHGLPVAPASWWDVSIVVAVVSSARKEVGSREGMRRAAATSPFWEAWARGGPAHVEAARAAVLRRDLPALGEEMEASTHEMHATAHTPRPPLLYWRPETVACLREVAALRASGVGAWATMDAGPQVKVLCGRPDAARVAAALAPWAERVVTCGPGPDPVVEGP